MAFGDKWRFFDPFGGLVIFMLKSFMYAIKYEGFRAPETPKFFVNEVTKGFSIKLEIKKTKIQDIELISENENIIMLSLFSKKLLNAKIEYQSFKDVCLELSEVDASFSKKIFEWFNEYFYLQQIYESNGLRT